LTHSILEQYGGIASNSLQNFYPLNSSDIDDEPDFTQPCYYYDLDALKSNHSLRSSFNIFSINAQSIYAKIDEIKVFLDEAHECGISFDALCIQETWLESGHDPSLLAINGYKLLLQGRSCSIRGGLAIYLRDSYEYKPFASVASPNWEGQFITLYPQNSARQIILGNIYRRPDDNTDVQNSFFTDLSLQLDCMSIKQSDSILAGDFNLNLLHVQSKSAVQRFLDHLISQGFHPSITLPTRFNERSATLIDNLFCKLSRFNPNMCSGIILKNISDHQGYFVALNRLPTNSHHSKLIKIIKKPDNFLELVANEIASVNICNQFDSAGNPDTNYAILENALCQAIHKFTEVKYVRFRKHKHKKSPWMSTGILISIRFRDKLFKRWKKSPQNSDARDALKINLSTYNKILKKTIRQAKSNYYYQTFENSRNDIRSTWRNINLILKGESQDENLPKKLVIDGTEVTAQEEIINSLNSHFATVGEKIASSIEPCANTSLLNFLEEPPPSSFSFTVTSTEMVRSTIMKLKSKSSSAADGMSTRTLKSLSHVLAEPICLIFNQSVLTGIFPDALKIAKVRALFKKGDTCNPNNYRPISILPAISKVFEKLMQMQLTSYFENHGLLCPGQYGFRSNHSTEFAAIELIDRISLKLEQNLTPLSIFIDLSKAFDCLNHEILLCKLQHYGLQTRALSLIRSYLSNRKQFVETNNFKSETCRITTGVPQGSILGPFLFLVYLNDFKNASSKFKFINYADDTTLISTVSSFSLDRSTETINNELQKIQKWLNLNKLSLNIDKTKLMYFFHPRKHLQLPQISLNGRQIERVENFNYLGILINQHLSWSPHISLISSKISRVCGVLSKLRHFLPPQILKTIYSSLITCHLNYGVLLWGSQSERIEKLQKKALRIITNSRYNAHTDPLFVRSNQLKVNDILRLKQLQFFFKWHANNLPLYFRGDFITFHSDVHSYGTRNRDALMLPRFLRGYTRTSLRYSLVNCINNTPNQVLSKVFTHSYWGFKNYAKQFFLSEYNLSCNVDDCFVCNRLD
jgi:hypothetical protein